MKLDPALVDEWNQKLADSGFDDIEGPDGRFTDQFHNRVARYDATAAEYFYQAGHYLTYLEANLYGLGREQRLEMWRRHAEGENLTPFPGLRPVSAWRALNKLQAGFREWLAAGKPECPGWRAFIDLYATDSNRDVWIAYASGIRREDAGITRGRWQHAVRLFRRAFHEWQETFC